MNTMPEASSSSSTNKANKIKHTTITNTDRQKVIDTIFNEGQSVSVVAKRFKMAYTTVQSISKVFEEEGQIEKKPSGGVHRKALSDEAINWLTAKVDECLDLTLKQLSELLEQELGQKASTATISRNLKTRKYTIKLMRVVPEARNMEVALEARSKWVEDFLAKALDRSTIIYVDETGFNLHLHHKFGRSKEGSKVAKEVPTQKGRNLNICAAMGQKKIYLAEAYLGSCTGDRFTTFLANLFQVLAVEEGEKRFTIIMDNASFHKVPSVMELFSSSHHDFLFLPPYSPYLNPIESMFGKFKQLVKLSHLGSGDNSLLERAQNAILQIGQSDCEGWFHHVESYYAPCLRKESIME